MSGPTEVFPIGAEVDIGPADNPVQATVTAVFIRSQSVAYEVVWWDGRTRTERCLEGVECRPRSAERLHIGFRP